MDSVRKTLFEQKDEKYRTFQCALMPTVDPETVIGVRTPEIKKLAKQLYGTDACDDFLNTLPHRFYEENNLHAFIIGLIKDFSTCINAVEQFLPYVNNWATCDGMRPKCFVKNKDELLPHIIDWMSSSDTYTVRYGIGMLMVHFLDNDFKPEFLSTVASIKSDEYYVNMMIAWYFATALAKQYEFTLPYIENHILNDFTHKKAIQKAIESYRITSEKKLYLKTLK